MFAKLNEKNGGVANEIYGGVIGVQPLLMLKASVFSFWFVFLFCIRQKTKEKNEL